MIERLAEWPERLQLFIEERRNTPFEWGKHDCALFACDAVLAMTGVDIAESFRGKYSTALEAARILVKYKNIGGLAEEIGKHFGIPEVLPNFAGRGDIILTTDTIMDRGLFGVCLGNAVAVPLKDALGFADRESILRAWKI